MFLLSLKLPQIRLIIMTMSKKDIIVENLLCLAAGIIVAIAMIAIICGDGDKGLLDLF